MQPTDSPTAPELRAAALRLLCEAAADRKARGVRALAEAVANTASGALAHASAEAPTGSTTIARAEAVAEVMAESTASGAMTLDCDISLSDVPEWAGRPERPVLVSPRALPRRDVGQREGRAALLHALAHIEFNAINLALDAIARFPGLPRRFYLDWLGVAAEEALHFSLLVERLAAHDTAYGDFPAHDGLWEMARRTHADPLARMALVPRTLEARGLDAAPAIRARLAQAGDTASAAVLDVILRDEIGHVRIGNHWFRWLCERVGREPHAAYRELARRYQAPRLKGPFNLPARRAAGFDEAELDALEHPHAVAANEETP